MGLRTTSLWNWDQWPQELPPQKTKQKDQSQKKKILLPYLE